MLPDSIMLAIKIIERLLTQSKFHEQHVAYRNYPNVALEKGKAEEHSDLGEHRVVFQKIKTFWHPSKINATQNSYRIH